MTCHKLENILTRQTRPKLVWNAQRPAFTAGNIKVHLCHEASHLPETTIQVQEEDTWRVLSSDISINEQRQQHPVRVMTDLLDQEPSRPGNVLIHGPHWYAINYDLDQSPICQPQWLRESMSTILLKAEENNISSLCIPLPGVAHGHISLSDSVAIIIDVIQAHQPERPISLWIRTQAENIHALWQQLKAQTK
jgi:hypothetical protein